MCSQAAVFDKCVNKVRDEVQNNLSLLYGELGKGISSQKVEKASVMVALSGQSNDNYSYSQFNLPLRLHSAQTIFLKVLLISPLILLRL